MHNKICSNASMRGRITLPPYFAADKKARTIDINKSEYIPQFDNIPKVRGKKEHKRINILFWAAWANLGLKPIKTLLLRLSWIPWTIEPTQTLLLSKLKLFILRSKPMKTLLLSKLKLFILHSKPMKTLLLSGCLTPWTNENLVAEQKSIFFILPALITGGFLVCFSA